LLLHGLVLSTYYKRIVLSLQNITLRYAKKIALKSVSMTVEQGEVLAVVGPNGSGKSTLLKVLSGNIPPSDGEVRWDDLPLTKISARLRAQTLAFVPQETQMPFAYTVEECVALGEKNKEAREAAVALMELESLRHTPLPSLSGGERQRAGIARGIAQQTPYLLLDEPTAHLDVRYQERLFGFLKTQAETKKLGVVVVLHDLERARRIADRVLVLHQGEIVGMGSPKAVLTPDLLKEIYGVSASFFL
jgi:iron complex transport system ATP-binding protein